VEGRRRVGCVTSGGPHGSLPGQGATGASLRCAGGTRRRHWYLIYWILHVPDGMECARAAVHPCLAESTGG
jgi:hypothetical protein